METEGELRASSDQMLELLARLQEVEGEKRSKPLGSPEFVALAGEAERLSRLVFRWSGVQLQMAERTPHDVAEGRLDPKRLSAVEPRPLDRLLAEWREAQIRLEIAKPGTPEAEAAADDVERLREEYRAAAETKRATASRDGKA